MENNIIQQELFEIREEKEQVAKKENDVVSYQNIVLKSNVIKDEYTDFIAKAFDLKVSDTSTVLVPNKLNLERLKPWNIGVICGSSGSGKSTILRHLAQKSGGVISSPSFDEQRCLISNFDKISPKEATMLLSSIGLASVPTWIRPYNVLSNGEKYRANLAKAIYDAKDGEIIFMDEYTSVVDRNVAKAMSNALQKYIRKTNKRIILASCHYDIFDWLLPDWIYDLNKGGALLAGDCLRRERPKIELQVFRTTCDTWERFKKYHYMTSDLNESSTCFCFVWEDKLVAFVGVLPFPSGTMKNAFRGHRTVVLPDFQGLGIGSKVTSFIAAIYKSIGRVYYTKTVNPALGKYREASPLWQATPRNLKIMEQKDIDSNMMGGLARPSYCHKYIGQPIYGYEELLLPIEEIRYNNSMKGQLTFDF